MKQAFEVVGDDGIVAPWLPDCPFNQGFFLRGLEAMLVDAADRLPFFDRLMRFRLRQSLTLLPEVVAGRADLGCVGANVGNARLVSRAYYDRYIAPYDQAYVRAIELAGLACPVPQLRLLDAVPRILRRPWVPGVGVAHASPERGRRPGRSQASGRRPSGPGRKHRPDQSPAYRDPGRDRGRGARRGRSRNAGRRFRAVHRRPPV